MVDSRATTTAKNMIIAHNGPSNCAGSLVSSGHNMEDANTCGLDSDPTNPDATDGDCIDTGPMLGPLQNNGGPTETRALLDGSPAIDAGEAPFPLTDQRGITRPQGTASDIGAFELEVSNSPPNPPELNLVDTSDSGSSQTDDRTNDSTPTFNGRAGADSTIEIYDNGSPLGEVKANGSGDWEYTVSESSPLNDGEHLITAAATDAANNTSVPSSLTVQIDTQAPNIQNDGKTIQPNPNGWYDSLVTNNFSASDEAGGSGLADSRQASFQKSSGNVEEGSAVRIPSDPVADVAGNENQGIDSAEFKIDLTKPLLDISGPADNASFDLCSLLQRPSFGPSDNLSGLDGTESDSWLPSTVASKVGTYTYTADARDFAGNSSSDTREYNVTYGATYGGVLQPINAAGTSNFKLGSTVPVEFKLMCGTTPVTDAVAKLEYRQLSAVGSGEVNEAFSTCAATTGNLFRYDSTGQQYIFNPSTKSGFSTGKWELLIRLDDGITRTARFDILK